MPTILRFGAFRVMIYTDDHSPPHVHVDGKGGLLILYLHAESWTVSVRQSSGVSKRDIRAIQQFVSENLGILWQRRSDYMVSDSEHRAATRRGREMRKNVPHAITARYDARLHRVIVVLSNQLEIAIAPELSQALHKATPRQLKDVQVDGAGYHLFFPKLDDGIYLPSLLQGIFGAQKWLEKQAIADRKAFASGNKTPLAA